MLSDLGFMRMRIPAVPASEPPNVTTVSGTPRIACALTPGWPSVAFSHAWSARLKSVTDVANRCRGTSPPLANAGFTAIEPGAAWPDDPNAAWPSAAVASSRRKASASPLPMQRGRAPVGRDRLSGTAR
jgi:hypothetical protein